MAYIIKKLLDEKTTGRMEGQEGIRKPDMRGRAPASSVSADLP